MSSATSPGVARYAPTPARPQSALAGRLDRVANIVVDRQHAPRAAEAMAYDLSALSAWVADGQPGERRADAEREILGVLRSGRSQLILYDMGLTGLPELPPVELLNVSGNRLTAIHALPELRVLNCSGNPELRDLPEDLPEGLEILDCSRTALVGPLHRLALHGRLRELDLSGTTMLGLPALPDALHVLRAADCGIGVPPPSWPPNLETLILRDNRLSWLYGLPTHLRECDLSNNRFVHLQRTLEYFEPCLSRNRRSVGATPRIDLTGNHLSARTREVILRLNHQWGPIITFPMDTPLPPPEPAVVGLQAPVEVNRYLVPNVRALDAAVSAWYPPSSQASVARLWTGFAEEPGAYQFSAFVEALGNSPWRNSPGFVADLCLWLGQLADDEALRKTTFAISLDATRTCHDRVLYAYLGMRLEAALADVRAGLYDGDAAELLKLADCFHAFQTLSQLAREKVAGRVARDGADAGRYEELEVYLAYAQRYKDRLPSFLGDASMIFEGHARLKEEDYTAAGQALDALKPAFPEYLSNWPPFLEALKRWNGERFTAIEAQLVEKTYNRDGDFERYQRERGFEGMAALEGLRHELLAPLVQEYLKGHGVDANRDS